MVISHKYRYIFIQLEKTASGAIAQELREHYDGVDVLWKHARYEDFLAVANDNEKKYFAFAGMRNPLDIVVSRYHLRGLGKGGQLKQHLFLKENNYDFDKFFLRFFGRGIYDDQRTRKYHLLDFIYRYENLQEDFSFILNRLGISQVRPLPVRNQTPNKTNFVAYYKSPKIQRRAQIVFGSYFKRWRYFFPGHWGRITFFDKLMLVCVFSLMELLAKIFRIFFNHPVVYRWRITRLGMNVLPIRKK